MMTIRLVVYNFAHYFNNSLKIYTIAAKNLSYLQAEIVSIQNTSTLPPLADTPDLLSESH
jgi:hypothetical protein